MENIVNMIATNGIAVVIVAYFLFKDYKQTSQMITVLGEIKEILSVVKAYVGFKEGGKE